MSADSFTSWVSRAVDFVFVDDRRASSMGVLFGAVMLFLTKVFAPALSRQQIVDFTKIAPYLYLLVGLFVFNVPRFFRGEQLPRSAEARLKLVRQEFRAKRLTREEAHALHKKILEEELTALLADRQGGGGPPRSQRRPRPLPPRPTAA
jgi:hypothetical protein